MKKQILQFSVVQTAKVMAVIYVIASVPVAAFMVLYMSALMPSGVGLAMLITMPLAYGACGFLGSILCALVYNAVAARLGGIEFTTAEVGAAVR